MINPMRLAGQVAESVLAVGGIRVGLEEPKFKRHPLTDTVEIRRYGARIAAETTVVDDENGARNVGFRRLAGYIFGGNHGAQSISMTAPVVQSARAENGWTIRFFMPAKWTMQTLPMPNDDQVRLVPVPAQTVAVLGFSGDWSPKGVARRTNELLKTLRDKGIEPVGGPETWFYDPPWTLPMRRRNEIAVPVDPASTPT
ncbi:heme-binding protein [Mycobacterium saskatchewanense]|nr:heme-binding protein [Mycobacterium saskatchewanense]